MKTVMKCTNPKIQSIRSLRQNFHDLHSKTLSPTIIWLFAYLLIGVFPPLASADTATDGNYSIDVNTIDTNPQPSPKQEVLGTSSNKPNEFTTGSNYTVISSTSTLSLVLSQNTIDYGILSSTNPVIRTSDISLYDNNYGGEVLAYENHVLTSSKNDVIQNTSCDNGNCTPEIAAIWVNTLTYGFGYRCDSTEISVCDAQFSPQNYYKPFADNSADHTPEFIMSTPKGKSQSTITYKANISGTQKAGSYYNSITYIAIPKF